MYSIVETFEDGNYMVVSVQTIWLKNGKLHWRPGKNPDRKTYATPQADWLKFDYKLLKTGIENEIITATAVVNKSPPKMVVKDNDNIDNPFSSISLESELAFHELFDGMLNGDPSKDNGFPQGFTVQNDNSVEESVQPT
ncbi:hypothetical protein Bhyg_05403, partial [Pseudolycoriella hygida]